VDNQLKRIFLSYGHDDYAAFAVQLKSDLEARGYQVWFDLERIKAGGDWEIYIEQGLEWVSAANGHFVLLMTPHSVRRPGGYCLNEIARALVRRLHIVPVLLAECEQPLSICRLQYLDMTDCFPVEPRNPRYLDKVGQLVKELESPALDFDGVQSRLLATLEPIDFGAELRDHLRKFIGRKWLIGHIQNWLANDAGPNVYWLAGEAGSGKTALAAWLSFHLPEVAALHFCRFTNTYSRDPRRMVLSLAYQISTQVPDYRAAVLAIDIAALARDTGGDAGTLCDELIVKKLPPEGHRQLIIIDGLDEATVRPSNAVARLIKNHLLKIPGWMRILVTSRPETEVSYELQAFTPEVLDPQSDQNRADARTYIEKEFAAYAANGAVPQDTIEKILGKSEANFLYLSWLGAELAAKKLTLSNADTFPQGLGETYSQFFDRQFPDVNAYQLKYRPAVAAILAAREPLETDLLARLFQWTEDERYERLAALGSMFVDMDLCRPFHKSLLEWIVDRSKAGPYRVDPIDGDRLLADRGWTIFQKDPDHVPAYIAKHLPAHLYAAKREDDLTSLLLNFAWMRNKLQVTDVLSVISDFDFLPSPTDQAAELIRSALRLSAPALLDHKAQLPGQLLGRLMSFPQAKILALMEQCGAWQGNLWLRPLSATLTPPGTTLLATMGEPGGGIQAIAVSDDGRTVAFAVHDERNSIPPAVRVWRLSGGAGALTVSNGRASSLALSPDGSVLALAGADLTVSVWSLVAGEERPLYSFPAAPATVLELVFIDSSRLLAVTEMGEIQTWDLGSTAATMNSTATLAQAFVEQNFSTMALAHHARRLFTGAGAKELKEWSLDSGSSTIHQLRRSFGAVAATPDARVLVVGDLQIEIWTRKDNEFQLSRTLPGHAFSIDALAVTGDGARVISATYSEIHVWDLQTGRSNPVTARADNYIVELGIRADGKQALANYKDGAWKVIDTVAHEISLANALPAGATLLTTPYEESCALFGHGEELLFWNAENVWAVRAVRVVDPQPNDRSDTWWALRGYAPVVLPTSLSGTVAITADHKRAVTITSGECLVWEVETGAVLARMEGWKEANAVALFPDGSHLAAGVGHTVMVWDLQNGKLVRTLVGPTWFVDCLAAGFTRQGLRIIAGSRDKIVRVWDPAREQPLHALTGHTYTISDVRFLPGMERFVSAAGDNSLRVWNLAGGCCEAVYTADAWALCCVPTPDGSTILAGDMAGNLHFLELAGQGQTNH
jgi:WD40 repeat protein